MKKMILMGFALVFVLTGCGSETAVISPDEAKAIAEDFVNNTLLQGKDSAEISDATNDLGLYKFDIKIGEGEQLQEISAYLTLDGKKFFPASPLDIEEEKGRVAGASETKGDTPPPAEVSKTDKPKVELFVMSHCPFGTQAEKGILPVAELLGDKIDFEIRFCDYAMHAKKELDEQLNQECIQREYPDKFNSYLSCFLEDETFGSKCMKDNGINEGTISTCVAKVDTEFKVTEMFNDKSTWASGRFPKFEVDGEDARKYGVKGSPSLVVNGVSVNSGRSESAYLASICSAFNNEPEECQKELSSANPSSGFGFDGAEGGANGGCGG